MSDPTYDLFFTGRDDPRRCVIIGEDTKPIYFCFETPDRGLINARTMISNSTQIVASFDWSPGNHLGTVQLGTRQFPMAHLICPGSSKNARAFVASDGQKFEWRRCVEHPTSYDLYAVPNVRIAAFRRYETPTVVESLLALCLNRWVDIHGM